MMGHTLGAAGGLEAIVCAQVLKHGEIPPTKNLENPALDDGCDLNYCPGEKVRLSSVDDRSVYFQKLDTHFGKRCHAVPCRDCFAFVVHLLSATAVTFLQVVPDVKPKVAISDNLGFGGHNAALSFKL